MKRGLLLVIALAFLVSGIPVFAEYNKDATVKAMRENLAGLMKAKKAAALNRTENFPCCIMPGLI